MTQQITIIDKVKEIVTNSGVPLELDVTQLSTLAERGKAIESVDDENFLPVKREMQKTRKELTEYFKAARDGFNKQAKAVIEVERAVLGEFTPEEERLIALDKAEKERVIKEQRLEALPAKKERIATAGIEFTDEEILGMTDADFEIEYNVRLGAKLEADRIADQERREAEQAKIDAEKAEIQRQKDEADRIEKAREEERKKAEEALKLAKERAEREAREAKERVEREKKEAEERLVAEEKARREKAEREAREAKEKEEREQQEAAEAKAKQEADKKYQAFLKKNKYDENTDLIIEGKIYRLVAEFKG